VLPLSAMPKGNGKMLHFFETGTNKLHLVSVDGRRKGSSKVIQIPEFVVPSFHASIISDNG
jgi:hypothetical protein